MDYFNLIHEYFREKIDTMDEDNKDKLFPISLALNRKIILYLILDILDVLMSYYNPIKLTSRIYEIVIKISVVFKKGVSRVFQMEREHLERMIGR